MFPSANSLSAGSSSKLDDTDWLYNQSFQVPVETLADDNNDDPQITNQQTATVSSDSDDDVKVVKEIFVDESKKKKKKKKKSRDSNDSRSRSRSPKMSKHSHRRRGNSSSYHRSKDLKRKDRVELETGSKSPTLGDGETKIVNYGNAVFLEEVGLPPEKAYRQDKRPDRNNLAFDSVYNLLVPSYNKKNCFKSKCLLEILRKVKQRPTQRYFNSKLDEDKDVTNASQQINVEKRLDLNNLPEIIPVSGTAHRIIQPKLHVLGDSLKDFYDPMTSLYIKAKDSLNSEINKPEEDITPSLLIAEKKLKTKEFNEHLRSNPHDIETWFKFLQWQENSFIWSAATKCTKSRETVLADKKLSIVDKALESNPKCMRLILERLDIMRFISTPSDLEKEWKRLIFIYPNNPTVWKNYFIFLQTHIAYFSMSKLSRAFQKCFDIFNSMLEGTFQTHQITPNLENEILKCIFHFTICLLQAGYPEKSIAIWQILIEFNLFVPEILFLEQPLSEWKALLEPFWDSGCPRFGEPEAIGWNNVMRTKRLNLGLSRLPIDELEEPILDQYANNRAKLWLELESIREKYYWLPVKGPDADQADDTERNVSIDDLVKILFRFRQEETKYQMVCFFLRFLGAIDSSDFLDTLFIIDDSSILSPIPSFLNLRPNMVFDDFISFQDRVFIQSIEKFKDGPHEKELIIARLKFLISQVGLSFKYKEVKKIIKDYLKVENNRNDLDLWNLLTDLELKKDDSKEACNIFETAISLFTGRTNDSCRLFSLTRSYCELLFGIKTDLASSDLSYIGSSLKESEIKAIKTIASVTLGQNIETCNSPLVLRSQKILGTMVLAENKYSTDILFCSLLFNLLVDDSFSAYNQCGTIVEDCEDSSRRKDFYTIYLQLLIVDIKRTIKPLSRLREICRQALDSFPMHKPFLSLFINIESNVALPISVDRFFAQLIRKTESSNLIIWIYNIHFELKRLNIIKEASEGYQSCDGIVRRINGLFERCLSFPCNQGIILLWRAYLKFNIERTSGNVKKAESIIYRALQHCPWSKIIYMDAVHTFPHLLPDMINIMIDKEIKLRTPMEEIDLLLKGRGHGSSLVFNEQPTDEQQPPLESSTDNIDNDNDQQANNETVNL